ncbi:complement C1q domain-containing protein [Spirosoma koreense]
MQQIDSQKVQINSKQKKTMKVMKRVSSTFLTAAVAAALFVSSSAMAQVKIGTNPTTIGASSNLEVEAATSGRKTSVDKTTGQVTIADGTEGTGKVFTSDANGGGSWQKPTQDVDVLFSVVATATTSIPTGAGVPDTKINYGAAVFDKNNSFNLATDQLTIPTAGFYLFSVGIQRAGSPVPTNSISGYIYVNGARREGNLWDSNINAGEGYTVTTTRILKLAAGDVVDVRAKGNFANDVLNSGSGTFLQVSKVSN